MSPRYIGDNHKLALLLDYDGTLAPIATHPDLAILPLETKNVLQRLSNMSDVYIAIISGRNVNNVKSMVGIEGITYAGNHGLEILHPDGSKFVHPMPAELEDKVASLMQTLQEQVREIGSCCNKYKYECIWYRSKHFSLIGSDGWSVMIVESLTLTILRLMNIKWIKYFTNAVRLRDSDRQHTTFSIFILIKSIYSHVPFAADKALQGRCLGRE